MTTLRTLIAAVAFFATAAAAQAGSPHYGLPAKVDVRADDVSFFPYQNETLLAAEGHVLVHAGKRSFTANSLRYDVLAHKLLLTGDVKAHEGAQITTGVAYSLDLQTGDGVLMTVDPVPATYAVHDGDYEHEKEGPPPAKTFDQPDIDGTRPYIRSRHAIVTPNGGVRMSPALFPTSAGPAVRLPTFYYTIVRSQNIAVNALPGASFDQPFNLAGSPGSLLAMHVRYDSTYGPNVGFDERLVDGDHAYVAASVLPFVNRQFDLIAFEQLRPGLQQTINLVHTIGQNPYNSATYRLQSVGKLTTQSLTTSLNGLSNSAQFDLASQTSNFGHLFSYQLRGAYGYDHNYGGFPFSNDFRTTLGGSIYAPQFKVLGTSFDENYTYSVTTYDFPHEVQNGTLTLSAGHTFDRGNVQLFATATYQQNNDRYRDQAFTDRALGLPDPSNPYYAPDGTIYPGYFAYVGLNTYRAYQITSRFKGQGDNLVSVYGRYTDDFPQFHFIGEAPLTVGVDVTRRITSQLRVEVGRSYTFGWNHQYLSPQYTLSISP